MHAIKDFLLSFPPGFFPLLAAALGLSAFQQKIHKWISYQKSWFKVTVSVVLSSLLVLLPHWIGLLQGDKNLLGAYTAEVFTVMSVFYNFLLKEKNQLNVDLSPDEIATPVLPQQPTEQPAQAETAAEFGPQA